MQKQNNPTQKQKKTKYDDQCANLFNHNITALRTHNVLSIRFSLFYANVPDAPARQTPPLC